MKPITPDEARLSIGRSAKNQLERQNRSRTLNEYWIGVFVARILCSHKNLRVIPNPANQYHCDDCGGRP